MNLLAALSSKIIGFAFGELLEDLATADFLLRQYVSFFFQVDIDDRQGKTRLEILEVAFGQAIREFLQLMQQELEDADLSTKELQQYVQPLQHFVKTTKVLTELGKPFLQQLPEASKLAQAWHDLKLSKLPDSFDWTLLVKRYSRKAQAIVRESAGVQEILQSSKRNPLVLGQGSENPAIDPSLLAYRDALNRTYGHLRFDSLDTSGYGYSLKLWNLFAPQDVREAVEVLPQVYELPKSELERLRQRGEAEKRELSPEELDQIRKQYMEQPPQPVLQVIHDAKTYPCMVILGDPGSGKSSLVQYLALEWANSDNFAKLPVPIIVELRAYPRTAPTGNDFIDFIREGSNCPSSLKQKQFENLLQQGQAFILFDGLDEVFDPAQRSQVTDEILTFADHYPQSRILLTSRIIGYKGDRLRAAKFRHFILQDFSDQQVQEFIDRWHEFAYPPGLERDRKRDRLKEALHNSASICQLAGNPLLLTMMAILNRNQELPRDRAELYNQTSRVLLQQWDLEKALNPIDALAIDYKDKQAMLRRVAFYMQGTETGLAGNLIRRGELREILNGYLKELQLQSATDATDRIVDQLRTRNFILCFLGSDYYAFVHRTFLEYFCAWEFVWQFEKEQAIDTKYLKQKVFGKHYQDESWHEVLRLICGMIDSKFVGEIVEFLMSLPLVRRKKTRRGDLVKAVYTHLLLAADCISEARNQTLVTPISEKLLQVLKDVVHSERWGFVSQPLFAVMRAIATYWHDHPDTFPWLQQHAQTDKNSVVRLCAMRELARGWKNHPDTLPLIKQLCKTEKDRTVRRNLVFELARGWHNYPDTLSCLERLARLDNRWDVRGSAMEALALWWKDHPNTFSLIHELSLNDTDPFVRKTAVQILAWNWPNHPDTLPLIQQRVLNDIEDQIRLQALQELIRVWPDHPNTVDLLVNVACNDPFERQEDAQGQLEINPRQLALEELCRHYPKDPRLLDLLQDRAANDPDEFVREFAQQQILEFNQPWRIEFTTTPTKSVGKD